MKRTWFLYIMLLIGSIIAIRQIPVLSQSMSRLASYILYPILVIEHTTLDPIKTWYKRRMLAEELEKSLKQTEATCRALQQENIELQAALAHSNAVHDIAAFRNRYKTSHAVLAPILLKQFSDNAHYMFVDGGTNRGIEPDMVAVYKNCLIGRVAEVYRWYSKVVLTTDRACKVAAVCVRSGAQGIHEGCQDCSRTKLSFVSHLTKIKEGDLVISSGEGLVFPRGFALGHIQSYVLDGLHYIIDIEPLIDIRSLDVCYILGKGSLYNDVQKTEQKPLNVVASASPVTQTPSTFPVQTLPEPKYRP